MGHTVAVYNFKGGVGKTTTTLNLGYAWSRSFKVLLIDCDPQCNLTSALKVNESKFSVLKYLKALLHDQIPEQIEAVEITPYLHLIPGDYLMTELEANNQFLSFGPGIVQKFNYLIKKDYDLILLDLPTHFGILVKSVLANVDSILIPTIADSFSINGIKKLLTFLYTVDRKKPLNILGIFFNMYRDQLIHHREKFGKSVEEFEDLVLHTRVTNSIKISEAIDLGQSAYRITPENHTAQEFLMLSDELLAKFNKIFLGSDHISDDILEKIRP